MIKIADVLGRECVAASIGMCRRKDLGVVDEQYLGVVLL